MQKERKYSRRRSRTAWFGTFISMSLLLLLLMLGANFLINMDRLSKRVKEQLELDVYFYDTTNDADVKRIEKQIASHPYVLRAVFVSKDSAQATVARAIGEDHMNLLDENPFQSSINVVLSEQYVHADSAKLFESWVLNGNEELVEEVYYSEAQFLSIDESFNNIGFWIWIFALLLVVVAVVMIFTTIRLSISAQRFTIKTMEMVGAKSSFIKRPFILNSLMLGLASGIAAVLMFIGATYLIWQYNSDMLFGNSEFETIALVATTNQNDFKIFGLLFGAIVAGGILISMLSTWLALRKYIRIKADNLY